MVICSVCKQQSKEGKFCEVCGSPLVADSISSGKNSSGFGGYGVIKSDMKKNDVIWKVTKYPTDYEKKIKIKENECVFIDDGTGITKCEEELTTTRNSFKCSYVNSNFSLEKGYEFLIEVPIMKINKGEQLKVVVDYDLIISPTDIESFYKSLISIKDDNWTEDDVKQLIEEKISVIIKTSIQDNIDKDNGFDLRDNKKQIISCENEIKTKISEIISQYSLKLDKCELSNVTIDKYELNNILVSNLYA